MSICKARLRKKTPNALTLQIYLYYIISALYYYYYYYYTPLTDTGFCYQSHICLWDFHGYN